MSDIKFYIVGTAKSKSVKQYYISERWKMWGLLHYTKKIDAYWNNVDDFLNQATQDFAIKNNFQFVDLIDGVYALDKDIDFSADLIKKEISKNTASILQSDVQNLIFNGKKAYHAFLFGCSLLNTDFKTNKPLKKHIRECQYGKQTLDADNFQTAGFLSDKNLYLASNTSSSANAFDEFTWIEILNQIS
jgi:hypothetical protein